MKRRQLVCMTIRHDETASRFVLRADDGEAFVEYEVASDGGVVVTHTYVPPHWRGRGVAQDLLRTWVTWAADEGRTIHSRCSYASAWLAKNSSV